MSATTNQAAAGSRRLCPFCRRPLIYCTCDRGRDAIRAAKPGIRRMLDDLHAQRAAQATFAPDPYLEQFKRDGIAGIIEAAGRKQAARLTPDEALGRALRRMTETDGRIQLVRGMRREVRE